MNSELVVRYIDGLLDVIKFSDYAPNGWQVEGKKTIQRIATAVSASQDVIELAAQWQADALLVHHGYFWKNESPCLLGMKGERIKTLMRHDINLLAYHLPLDCHVEWGNNAQLGKLFELQHVMSHTVASVPNLVWSGELLQAYNYKDFLSLLTRLFGQIQPVQTKKTTIKHIAWCTGGAQDYIEFAAKLGVDAYISGEISERTYYQAQELGLHYFACGHHATEKLGIQALGEHLATQFQFEHRFIDSNNPY